MMTPINLPQTKCHCTEWHHQGGKTLVMILMKDNGVCTSKSLGWLCFPQGNEGIVKEPCTMMVSLGEGHFLQIATVAWKVTISWEKQMELPYPCSAETERRAMRRKTRKDKAALAGTGTKLGDLCFDVTRYDWGQGKKKDIPAYNPHLGRGLVCQNT